jgi:hypothetical protein
VLPLPPGRKERPPDGFTGGFDVDPSEAQVRRWIEGQPDGNAALRLPAGFVGLDVDDYDGKGGGATWRAHLARCGPLPKTWTIVNREDGVSGTRLYRADTTGPLRGVLAGGGVDVIHRGHRYIVLPLSLHPDGRTYCLVDSSWQCTSVVPAPADIPVLPESWQDALLRARRRRKSGRNRTHAAAATEPVEPVRRDEVLVELARDCIRDGRAKAIRDAAGVSLDDLAVRLHLARARAGHLESGRLRQPRPRLLEEYGRFLSEHVSLVR